MRNTSKRYNSVRLHRKPSRHIRSKRAFMGKDIDPDEFYYSGKSGLHFESTDSEFNHSRLSGRRNSTRTRCF